MYPTNARVAIPATFVRVDNVFMGLLSGSPVYDAAAIQKEDWKFIGSYFDWGAVFGES
jgi:hypothetical protein